MGPKVKAAVPHFLKALKDPKQRRGAIQLLGQIGREDPRVLPALMPFLDQKVELAVYLEAADALGQYGGTKDAKRIVPILLKELQRKTNLADPESDECQRQHHVVIAMGNLRGEAKVAVPVLMNLLPQIPATELTGGFTRSVVEALDKIDPLAGKKARALIQKASDAATGVLLGGVRNPVRPSGAIPTVPRGVRTKER